MILPGLGEGRERENIKSKGMISGVGELNLSWGQTSSPLAWKEGSACGICREAEMWGGKL
jgi:hypothetical protein